jgi:DNA-binding CsgD family transcriptional regulator
MGRKRRDVNPIDVIEAAYDLDVDDRTWLFNLATLVRPLLEGGTGLLAYIFDTNTSPAEWYADAACLDFDRAEIPLIAQLQSQSPDWTTLVHVGFDGLLAMSEIMRKFGIDDVRKAPNVGPYFEQTGLLDYVALQTVEPGGRGVVFTAGQTVARTFDRRTRRSWVRINTHIAAGRRLRHSMNLKAAVDEAILAPSGKLEHAEGEGGTKRMREALRDAVLRSEKARGKQRRTDPEAATEAWTAMVSGRWSLVDRFERGGRRYIVARRNEHNLPDPRALTQRECVIANLAALGKPNKLIGYELGVSESAVGTHLSQAMRKLGAKSRVDLIQLVAQLGVPRSEP